MGSPPDADADMRSGSVAPDQEQQGGPVESKLLEGFEVDVGYEPFSAQILQLAKQNYARHYEVDVEVVTIRKLADLRMGIC